MGRVLNKRFTGGGTIEPGAQDPERDYAKELMADFAGWVGMPHTPAVEQSFKRRGRQAYRDAKMKRGGL